MERQFDNSARCWWLYSVGSVRRGRSVALRGGGPGGGLGSAPELELAELDKAELRDAVRAPDVRAVAPVIPVKLVFPVSAAEAGGGAGQPAAQAAGPTWGVHAVGADRSGRTGPG